MAEILIVDDDLQLRQSFEKLLTGEGHTVRAASTGEAGIRLVEERSPDLVVMDVRMPGMDGLTAFTAMRKIDPKLPVIIMTAFGTTETAIEATRMGAFDYVLKPFDIPAVLDLIKRAVAAGQVMRGRVGLGPDEESEPGEVLVGVSRTMNEVYKAIGRAAPTDALVLIRGESGTGKELVARALYHYSQRAAAPFLVINCVAIPETLLESELFGYEKGAFTGAVNRRVGKIEQANHGTVFLDEIGDMPLSIQAKILRLLQEKKIERLGGREPIPVDVRILAATNRDLEAAVGEGRFREDLYYRLKVVTLNLPPLRERREDIPLLADYFLARFSRELDMPNPGLTPEAVEALSAHHWPGNVRELGNALHKALIFSRGAPLTPEDVLAAAGSRAGSPPEGEGEGLAAFIRRTLTEQAGENAFDQLMDHVGRLVVREALEITGGNRTRAARLLGLSRPTLLARIEKYGLKIGAQVS
jgi:nitrogen regulation protein NR(I)